MNRRTWILFAAGALIGLAVGLSLRGGGSGSDHTPPPAAAAEEATIWTCSMHPQIQLPEPGQCPICGMDLIPLKSHGGENREGAVLTLSPLARKLASVRTAPVERRVVTREIRLVGKLEPDETRQREIAAWVSGRIDRLHKDVTGELIRPGEPLYDIYSPEIYAAQEELLQALRSRETLSTSTLESTRLSARRTLEATREKLRLLGLTSEQIREIEERGAPSDHVTILAPIAGIITQKAAVEGVYVSTGRHVYRMADLSSLWLKMDAYEMDIAWIRLGQTVRFETDAYPGEIFEGTVSFIDPLLTEATRSIKVRVDVPNPDGRLLPGMFARAVVEAEIGMPEDPPLVVPASAPLLTGTRAVVYVADPEEEGTFHGRQITLGPRAGDWYVVAEGLHEGERVVVNGNFKIDSALQILARPSMMSPEGGGSAPGHHHPPAEGGAEAGATGSHEPQDQDADESRFADIPASFRAGLDDLLNPYFTVGGALSNDDLGGARAGGASLAEQAAALSGSELPEAARTFWSEVTRTLSREGAALAAAEDLDTARIAFDRISSALIRAVRRLGVSGNHPVFLLHCPMAFDNRGADWLQPEQETHNPYSGKAMHRCGVSRALEAPRDEE